MLRGEDSGLYPGPRLLVSGRVLFQTGGHGDKCRPAEAIPPIDACLGMVGVIADGSDEVRRAAREQLRRGADQLEMTASGGAMSRWPTSGSSRGRTTSGSS